MRPRPQDRLRLRECAALPVERVIEPHSVVLWTLVSLPVSGYFVWYFRALRDCTRLIDDGSDPWFWMAMLAIIAIVLFVLWLGGFVVFHAASGLIHLLLVLALISIVMHFVRGRSVADGVRDPGPAPLVLCRRSQSGGETRRSSRPFRFPLGG